MQVLVYNLKSIYPYENESWLHYSKTVVTMFLWRIYYHILLQKSTTVHTVKNVFLQLNF